MFRKQENAAKHRVKLRVWQATVMEISHSCPVFLMKGYTTTTTTTTTVIQTMIIFQM
jgi:hypothetical protein